MRKGRYFQTHEDSSAFLRRVVHKPQKISCGYQPTANRVFQTPEYSSAPSFVAGHATMSRHVTKETEQVCRVSFLGAPGRFGDTRPLLLPWWDRRLCLSTKMAAIEPAGGKVGSGNVESSFFVGAVRERPSTTATTLEIIRHHLKLLRKLDLHLKIQTSSGEPNQRESA